MLAEGGYQVGALAKLCYPDGIEIEERDHALAEAKTRNYLKQENVVLFEPAIRVDNFFVRIDVLVKTGYESLGRIAADQGLRRWLCGASVWCSAGLSGWPGYPGTSDFNMGGSLSSESKNCTCDW